MICYVCAVKSDGIWDDFRQRTMAEGEKSISYAIDTNAASCQPATKEFYWFPSYLTLN